LQEAGIADGLIKKFLASPAGTPSHKTALTEYLAYLHGVDHREALIKAALTANNEIDALATVTMLRMFASYHEKFSPLKTFISAGHLTLALSEEGTLLIALPFDMLYWNRETETVFDALKQFSQDKGILQRTVLLLGAATNTARQALEQRGFHTLERYLYAR